MVLAVNVFQSYESILKLVLNRKLRHLALSVVAAGAKRMEKHTHASRYKTVFLNEFAVHPKCTLLLEKLTDTVCVTIKTKVFFSFHITKITIIGE